MKRLSVRIPGRNNFSVAVLGPGAIGGFLSALFFQKNIPVTCIAKEETAEIISQNGIRLESSAFGDFIAHPEVVTYLDKAPDILFITTKATTLSDALKRVDPGFLTDAVIIPFLNGIEHMELLRSVYGKRVVAATIGNVEVKKVSADHIIHSTPSAVIELASGGDIPDNLLKRIASLFSDVGIPVKLIKGEAEVLWRKLARLNAIACTTSAANKPLGFIRRDGSWRLHLENCVRETAAVARAERVDINPGAVMAQIDSLPEGLGSSMQRDVNAGKPSEIDAIAGAVIRSGKKHGLECPTIEKLIILIKSRGKS